MIWVGPKREEPIGSGIVWGSPAWGGDSGGAYDTSDGWVSWAGGLGGDVYDVGTVFRVDVTEPGDDEGGDDEVYDVGARFTSDTFWLPPAPARRVGELVPEPGEEEPGEEEPGEEEPGEPGEEITFPPRPPFPFKRPSDSRPGNVIPFQRRRSAGDCSCDTPWLWLAVAFGVGVLICEVTQ